MRAFNYRIYIYHQKHVFDVTLKKPQTEKNNIGYCFVRST